MTVARSKKQYKRGELEDCSTDNIKTETKTVLDNLEEDEKNKENIPVNDNIQQSRKSSQNRQEPQDDTHNSSTQETTKDNRKKKWSVHYNDIEVKSDDSIECEADTSESDSGDERNTSENYKDKNSIGTKVNSIPNEIELDRLSQATLRLCTKLLSHTSEEPDLFNLNQVYTELTSINNKVKEEKEENSTYRQILFQRYNELLVRIEGNRFERSVESMDFRTVFADNFPVEVDEEIIKELFEPSCGHIEQIRIYTLKKYYGKKVNKTKRRKLTKVASITFSTISAAQKAVSKNPLWLNNYYVNIQFFDDTHINIETFLINRIFLLNVPHDVTKEMLCEFFDDCGEPLYIRYLHKANPKEEFTGIVYVQFQTPEAARLALQKNNQYLNGTRLTIAQDLTLSENRNLSESLYTSYQGLKAAIEKN